MNSDPKVSFIVVNYNGKHHLKECFTTIMNLKYPKELIEIIMVDNGSTDGSLDYVSNKFPQVKTLINMNNEGFAKPNNDAAKVATGEYLALINNDMRLDTGWLKNMLGSIRSTEDDNYACVGSKILNWDGSKLDFAGGSINFYGMGYQEDFGLDIEEANNIYNEDKDILFACGGAMLIRRDVFLEIGGFDEDYFAYFEDVDLGWRLWILGYKVRFCSSSICYHKHNSTSKKMNFGIVQKLYARNSLYTVFKNYGDDKADTMVLATILLKIFKGNKNISAMNERSLAEGKAQLEAINDFIINMPSMKEKRTIIQLNRKNTDEEIFNRFIDEPYKDLIIGTEEYLKVITNLSQSLEINKYLGERSTKLLIICTDNVGKKMAGPGIRYWEFAKELSKNFQVILAIPNKTDIEPENKNITIMEYNWDKPSRIVEKAMQCDMILMHGFVLQSIPQLIEVTRNKILIVDVYDPFVIENLAMFSIDDMGIRQTRFNNDLMTLNTQLQVGDYFICASESQKDFWIGMLTALGKVNPLEYDISSNLEKLIGVVPFGITNNEPTHNREALKEKIPNLKQEDKVIIWGGGVWNWFDPITLIKAVKAVSEERSDIKLFFMGVKHPNPDIPEMEMTNKAIALAEQFGIRDKYVFFNMDWVDYNDRQNFLLESHIGVSCHYENLETKYSFRTRILDYLWAELPIITTDGDYFAKEIKKYNLGTVVGYQSVEDMKEAIIKLADDRNFYDNCKSNIKEYKNKYRWSNVVKPLENFCLNPIKKEEVLNVNTLLDINQTSVKTPAGEIFEGIKIGQKFRCRYPNLYQVRIFTATYSRLNKHTLYFKLYDARNGKLLVNKSFKAEELHDNDWFKIEFEPILNSEDKEFYFYIESVGAEPGNAITIWSDNNEKNYGFMLYNEKQIPGSLCFKTFCLYSKEPLKNGILLLDPNSIEAKIDSMNNIEEIEEMVSMVRVNRGNKARTEEIENLQKEMENITVNVQNINLWIEKMNRRMQKLKKIPFLSRFKRLFK